MNNQLHPLESKIYCFHDISIACETNHPAIFAILDTMLGIFPRIEQVQGHTTFQVFCYTQAEQFSVQLPHKRVRTETMRLLTNTTLKYYRSSDGTTLYQQYAALAGVNGEALSIIKPDEGRALTQLVLPENYQAGFLRRYVLLQAIGQLVQRFGFEPCHAGVVTAPWDTREGALIIGASGSGKTTLSAGCACEGFGLLGDDLIMLRDEHENNTNSIHAFAISREVSLRSGTLDLWPNLAVLRQLIPDQREKRYCSIDDFAQGAFRLQTAIRVVLFPELTTETRSTVVRISRASTLQGLIDECLGKSKLPHQAQERFFAFLSLLAEQAVGYRIIMARGKNDGPKLVTALLAGEIL
jgi:hypothetical protein